MNYETWERHKTECENESQVSFQRMSEPAQNAMTDAHKRGAGIEGIGLDGAWNSAPEPRWNKGNIYRVSPSWPGPAKPEPKPEYEDKNVFLVGIMYRFNHPEEECRYNLSAAPGTEGFAGYVYEINGRTVLRPKLLFDSLTDGTYRLRVPKAVRFFKGAMT